MENLERDRERERAKLNPNPDDFLKSTSALLALTYMAVAIGFVVGQFDFLE